MTSRFLHDENEVILEYETIVICDTWVSTLRRTTIRETYRVWRWALFLTLSIRNMVWPEQADLKQVWWLINLKWSTLLARGETSDPLMCCSPHWSSHCRQGHTQTQAPGSFLWYFKPNGKLCFTFLMIERGGSRGSFYTGAAIEDDNDTLSRGGPVWHGIDSPPS